MPTTCVLNMQTKDDNRRLCVKTMYIDSMKIDTAKSGKHLVDKKACAKFIGIRVRTLDKYVALGRIPAIRLSQKIVRFDLDDVRAAL
jgi:hypothetical protein